MSILLATIPHTGTRFMVKTFEDSGLTVASHGWQPVDVYFLHLRPFNFERVKAFDGPIVCTMRDKKKIEASWRAGGETFGTTLDECFRCFNEIKHAATTIKIDDKSRRDMQLRAISELVGRPLHTDWTPVGARQ